MQKPILLILSSVWVEPNSSAAGGRMLQLIELFQSMDYSVVYASTASDSEFASDLSELNVATKSVAINDSSFDVFLKDLTPEIVLFDRFMVEEQFGWRVAEHCSNAVRVLDTEDLHCLRDARKTAYKRGVVFENAMLFSDVAKREIASIFRSDLTLMISEFEMDLLQSFFKVDQQLLHYLPILVEETILENVSPSFSERQDFVFIGNFLHEPNWNCVQVLKTEIWPELSKQCPDAKLLIYGAYPSQKVLQLHNPKERFFIEGRAESAEEVIKTARVLLAPIRFGAGIKGKLFEAMLYGTPSVTTSIGAEAMSGNYEWNGKIANDNQEFVQAAVELYSNEVIWTTAQKNGFEIIKNRFLKKSFSSDFTNRIEDLKANLEIYRYQNFIGAMLQHHTMQSTRFMSKWIETKNKSNS
ncbi:glycosyltransferase family 4 protein [Flavobacterium sp.]|uniref:glycosyltransferase n=1 Tax=Flavobacterium sp. TaxID=239 RepID=UPI0028BDC06C|nr:glycosyltransferase family 4 protein [Flavobacterium sp.]